MVGDCIHCQVFAPPRLLVDSSDLMRIVSFELLWLVDGGDLMRIVSFELQWLHGQRLLHLHVFMVSEFFLVVDETADETARVEFVLFLFGCDEILLDG